MNAPSLERLLQASLDDLEYKAACKEYARLRLKMNSTPEALTGCWLWLGSTSEQGYGRTSFMGKSAQAHRVSWLVHRFDPGKRLVLHRCDNRACVNPDHLFIGTQQDNVDDMMRKGRGYQQPRLVACKRGHPMSGKNLYCWRGKRWCLTCSKAARAARKLRGLNAG
jgi:hypothetical protein